MATPTKNYKPLIIPAALGLGTYFGLWYFGILTGDSKVTTPVGSASYDMVRLMLSAVAAGSPAILNQIGSLPLLSDVLAMPGRVKVIFERGEPKPPEGPS